MKIVILDDDLNDLALIYRLTYNYINIHNISDTFLFPITTPEKIFDFDYVDCYLLDVVLPNNVNGVDLAEKLLHKNPLANIIFISVSAEFSPPSHKIRPIGYLVKPFNPQFLFNMLDELFEYYNYFILTFTDNKKYTRSISANEILYITPYDYKNNTLLHLVTGSDIIARKSIKDWEEILDSKIFVHIYKLTIINIKHVKYIDDTRVIFHTEETLSCSKKYRKNAEQKLYNYLDSITCYKSQL